MSFSRILSCGTSKDSLDDSVYGFEETVRLSHRKFNVDAMKLYYGPFLTYIRPQRNLKITSRSTLRLGVQGV